MLDLIGFFGNWTGTLTGVRVATSKVLTTIPIGYLWSGTLTVTEDGSHSYVAYVVDVEGSAPNIHVVETKSGMIVDMIEEVTFDVFPDLVPKWDGPLT